MKNAWHKISYLGIKNSGLTLYQRNNILTNRINATICVVFIVLLLVTRAEGFIKDKPIGMGTYRVLYFIVLSAVNLILAGRGWFYISKILLIFGTPFLLAVLPTLYGFIEEESFVYYPYVLIAFSLIPQLILTPQKEKGLYWLSLVLFFFMVVFVDNYLVAYLTEPLAIVPIINEFYTFYKVVPIAIFIFIHASVYYLRTLNEKYEKEIQRKNIRLDIQNEELNTTIENLKVTQDQLIHSEKMAALGNLVSGVSHEINNPLNYISGGLFYIEDSQDRIKNDELIEIKEIDEVLTKSFDMISRGVKKISNVVQLLSVFSGFDETHKNEVSVSDIIDGTLSFVAIKIENQITITKNYGSQKLIKGYPDQLHKVILNILENSIEAVNNNESRGIINITTKEVETESKKFLVVEIENNGPNIEEKELRKIFEPFYSLNKEKLHTGLGLTIAFTIIKEHQGSLKIENTKIGVKTIIQLPIE